MDSGLSVGSNFILLNGIRAFSSSATVLTVEDTGGNDLMTITDAGTTGNVAISGDLNVTGTITGALAGAAAAGDLTGTTIKSTVVTSSLTTVGALASGSIAAGFGAIDNGTSNITTGGIITLDVDGAVGAAGSLTLGAGNDASIFFDATDLIIISDGAGASGIILDAEDDSVEIKGSGALTATFDLDGLDLVTGDAYQINGASLLSATVLGANVVTSSLTTVGALASGTIATGFGAIDNGTSNITTGGIITLDVDGAVGAAGSLTLGAGNDASIFFDATDLIIISDGAGASGIILDAEDDSMEIKGSGALTATFDLDC